ncbi:omega amino acid--pyruvate aminotransferase [Alteromonas australica]|jgi:beta-alanine--pyruvate transaminase|uniref:Omega amino acid--pyruvate aminotransferase n=5 Tax=Alteromonas australica TaxID=589873 RepID=A0A075NVD5_9ALTE|nr:MULTISPECIES: aspartate aminotransferase family protein [Alteromonas]MAF69920.1 aspartate aminotransferase family protein [Alteromonas sp.]AIF97308.1 omega amino acid--pyruvate aminotransferase [Alteromonas australica]AJP42430.1 omega amino acid--pyruvate aminotransferase [Alteromonas australica]MBU32900.1 aspartate aminotransferase family protein [Alteromonas sp.]QPL50189.1 aspartate aminotransferase family protein [Alteromonas sp. B31-7]|tara:strand:- start:6000 stop:7349 length:1350 start_codon:yes stop_codon:yes gene_type:complete
MTQRASQLSPQPMDALWMPYTANRQFKSAPRMITGAQGNYLIDDSGRKIFDGLSGLWTCGAGHNRPEITEAVAKQLATLDYAPAFQYGHNLAFELAERLAAMAPSDINKVFFTNSGSEAADTATKMARAYWRQQGQPTKTRIIGRAKGYHGASWGGISFGGIGANRKMWGPAMESDHLSHTLLPQNAFSEGIPAQGANLADELIEMVALHDASNIAAVIVEPMSGSAGVIVPPAGYLKRLRQLCDEHDILLIFDEVITGFGRTGDLFGANTFDVVPDMINVAKQLTNGAIPMGAVLTRQFIYDTVVDAGGAPYNIELPHGYTYSGHPVACAAAMASLDILEQEKLVARVAELSPYFEQGVHSLKGMPFINDIRNLGFAAGFTIESYPGEPARRPFELAMKLLEKGFYVRYGGDTLQLGIPFTTEKSEIDALINAMQDTLMDAHGMKKTG